MTQIGEAPLRWMENRLRFFGAVWPMIQNNHLLQAAIGYPAAGFAKDAIRWLILAVRLWIKRKVFITTTLQESYAAIALGWLRERPEMQSLSERVARATVLRVERQEADSLPTALYRIPVDILKPHVLLF